MAKQRKGIEAFKSHPATDSESLDFLPTSLDVGAPKAAQLYNILRHAIVTLHLEPGTTINEKAICDRLSVSRTPLREAVQQLNREHLVTVIPHSGTRVAKIDLRDVYDGQFIREALELKCSRAAARVDKPDLDRALEFNLFKQERYVAEKNYDEFYLLDEEFHSLICSYGSSRKVWDIVHEAKGQLDRIRRLALPGKDHLKVVLDEHKAIYEAIKGGSEERAEQAMSRHLNRVYETIKHLTSKHSAYFG